MNAHLDGLDPRVRILVEQVAARLDMNRVLNHREKVEVQNRSSTKGLRLKLAGRSIEMAAH
jgi:hypothetical protein